MQIIVKDNRELLSRRCVRLAEQYIRENPGRLLCFAAGDTTRELFELLTELHIGGQVNLNTMYYVTLDEVPGGARYESLHGSFFGAAGVDPHRVLRWNPDAADRDAECARMEKGVRERGGIGLAILGVGPDGALGLNEPGVAADSVSHATSRGLTLGMKRLMQAETLCLMAFGAEKAPVMRRALIEEPSPDCPASLLQRRETLQVLIDRPLFTAL